MKRERHQHNVGAPQAKRQNAQNQSRRHGDNRSAKEAKPGVPSQDLGQDTGRVSTQGVKRELGKRMDATDADDEVPALGHHGPHEKGHEEMIVEAAAFDPTKEPGQEQKNRHDDHTAGTEP